MLERRTNQSMLKLIQPKHSSRVSSGEKASATDKEGNSSAAVNENADNEPEEQIHQRQTLIPKPGPIHVSTPPAVERMSPIVGPGLGKLTYNPITHAPSTHQTTKLTQIYFTEIDINWILPY